MDFTYQPVERYRAIMALLFLFFLQFECPRIKTPRIFRDTKKATKEMKDALNCLANQIAVINRKGNEEKAEGSAWSFTGSMYERNLVSPTRAYQLYAEPHSSVRSIARTGGHWFNPGLD